MHDELLLSAKADIDESSTTSSTTTSHTSHGIGAPCFPAGFTEEFTGVSYIGGAAPGTWTLTGTEDPVNHLNKGFDKCTELYRKVLRLDQNSLCDKTYHGQCSIAGEYQPPLPEVTGAYGKCKSSLPEIPEIPESAMCVSN